MGGEKWEKTILAERLTWITSTCASPWESACVCYSFAFHAA